MRDISYRGMIRNTGKFVYGFPQVNRDGRVVIVWQDTKNKWFGEQVVPETVGQFTGFEDIDGGEIYEGDICKIDDLVFAVEWLSVGWSLNLADKAISIIGNIHQNKELLK